MPVAQSLAAATINRELYAFVRFAAFVGIFFGDSPALKTSRLDLIDALQFE